MANQINEKGTGLLPLPANPGGSKDFSHTTVFGAVKSEDIPFDFTTGLKPIRIKDQQKLDFCPGYGTTEVSEDQEGMELDPLWQFAQIKRYMIKKGIGTVESYGADLRSAGMALVTFGSLPQIHAPLTINSGTRNFLANPDNYPASLYNIAMTYKKKSMFFVDGPNDWFDNIRAVLYKNRGTKVSILTGVLWRPSWTYAENGIVPKTGWETEQGGGHCIKIFDQKIINNEIYLVVQNSWGEDVGDKGLFYFPRNIINELFAPYGFIYFSDMPVEDAKYYNENGVSVQDNWAEVIIKSIWNFIISFFTHHNGK